MDPSVSPQLTALRSLYLVAAHHGLFIAPEELVAEGEPDLYLRLLRVMRRVGLRGRLLRGRGWKTLTRLGSAYPVLAQKRDGSWLIIVQVGPAPDGSVAVAVLDPQREHEGVTFVPTAEFLACWDGTLMLCKRAFALTDENQPFGFRWFMPEIIKHADAFKAVALAAIMSSIISFGFPILFQVLVDKVITHQSYQTLQVIVIVFLLLTLFDGLFNYVRQSLMIHAGNKIDTRLASRTFHHLLSLPLPFFEGHTAGVLIRHMQQTEKLRFFLTGRLFQTLLDAVALPLLLVLLVFYSPVLTLVVLLFSLAIAGVIAAMVPTYRRLLDELYQAEGAKQAHLVETLHSMRAVKSLVLEGARQRSWDQKVLQAVRRHASVGRIGIIGGVLTQGLEKLMQIAVLSLGAIAVFDGNLSLGALVAFNMLSGRVTGPLIQIVALINEYQEAALSVKMLGTVMNSQPERNPAVRQARPLITGALEFDQVSFAYPGAASPALDRVSFRVEEGQMIGIVGRSGSGKTTVTRLVQGIHTAQQGLIRLDGADVRHIDLNHLRRSMGVVLQENLLFRGTIRENIAAARPDASLAEILEAARLAGADEFIDRLPHSYDTFVEEGAANFSGGQRQRIAIARALLTQPRLLIFDEATSALDPESEAIVQRNLVDIARGRTTLIVSHRLSSLVESDAILVLEKGRMVDFAPHETLLERCPVYQGLWQTQTRHLR